MAKTFKTQIITYGIIGTFSSLIHIGAASFFVRFFYESLLIANSVGFLTAFTFSYVCQSKFVFDANLTYKKAVTFFLIQSASLLLAVKLADLTENLSIYVQILIVACLLPVLTFFIHRMWTFAGHQKYSNKELEP